MTHDEEEESSHRCSSVTEKWGRVRLSDDDVVLLFMVCLKIKSTSLNNLCTCVVKETWSIATKPVEPKERKTEINTQCKDGDVDSQSSSRSKQKTVIFCRFACFPSAARSCLLSCRRGRAGAAAGQTGSDIRSAALRYQRAESERALERKNRVDWWKEEAECVSLSVSLCGSDIPDCVVVLKSGQTK